MEPQGSHGSQRSQAAAPRLVFVGGCPRSGTTLVQHVLDSHPRVRGGPEFDFTPDIAALWRRMAEATARGRTRWFYDEAQLDRAFTTLLRTLVVGERAPEGIDVVAEKTPSNVLVFEELARRLPDAGFVLVVRDPRGVAASLGEGGRRARATWERVPRAAASFGAVLRTIARHADAAARAEAALGRRLHRVRYESLVADPAPVIQALCDAVGIDHDPAMDDPSATTHARAEADLAAWRDPSTDGRPVDPGRADRWAEILTPRQQHLVAARFSRHPLFAGYFEEPIEPGPVTTLALRAVESSRLAALRRRLPW